MLKNYFKIAFRNFIKDKFYSFVNVAGLSLGLTVCLLLSLFAYYEFSYDKHFSNVEKKYRILAFQGDGEKVNVLPWQLADLLNTRIPEVKNTTRIDCFTQYENNIFRYKDKSFKEKEYFRADKEFFSIFDYKFISGNPETALENPNTIVITERIAKKYFSNENPIGKVLENDKAQAFVVTGVCENTPESTHLKFDFISSLTGFKRSDQDNWGTWNYFTYITTSSIISKTELEQKINSEFNKTSGNKDTKLSLQPITDIHLRSGVESDIEKNGNINDIYLYSLFGIVVLLVACVNYTNLSIAKFSTRLKEIGIRKTIGAERKQVLYQFFIESLIYVIPSLFFALIFTKLFLSEFNSLVGRNIELTNSNILSFALAAISLTIVTGLFSGGVPAFYFSKQVPTLVIKGGDSSSKRINFFRKFLTVFQFVISVTFLVVLGVITKQNNYLFTKNTGIEKENIIAIPFNRNFVANAKTLKNIYKNLPEVQTASLGSFLPSERKSFYRLPKPNSDDFYSLNVIVADEDYINTFGLKIINGTNFLSPSKERVEIILNESAVKMFGWKNPIGQTIPLHSANSIVVGVVKDYHYNSLHEKIGPLAFSSANANTQLFVKLSTVDFPSTIQKLKKEWSKIFPNSPFDYLLISDDYTKMYGKEITTQKALDYLSVIAVLISVIGLLSITSYQVEKRKKEFGIRKVLGASVTSIVSMINKEFLLLVFIANVLALPLAYYLINSWLQNYAYRIEIPWHYFGEVGIASLIISLITVSFQSIKSATANPVESLRYE